MSKRTEVASRLAEPLRRPLGDRVEAVKRKRCERSFYEFVKEAWPVLEPDTPFDPAWHIEYLCELMEQVAAGKLRRLIVNMPPRYGKSLIINVFLPVWLWLRDPSWRMMSTSYAAALSTKHSVDRRTLIESPWFQRRWGHKVRLAKGSNLKDEFSNTARGHMIATSVGAAATGKGGNLLIVDDLLNPAEAESDAERAFGIRWYRESYSTRLNNKKTGAIIIVEQRTHTADLTGHLLEGGGKRWKHVVLPAIAEKRQVITFPSGRRVVREVGDILWPEREDADDLLHQKLMMGSHAFECQYQQNPQPRGGNQFLDKWLHSYSSIPTRFNLKAMALDTAFSTGQEADFSAIAIVGYLGHPDGANPPGYYVERIWRGRVGFAELKRKTVEIFNEHNQPTSPIHMVLVEKASAGLSLIPELRAETGLPVIAVAANTDKRVRASRIEPLLESGLLYLPETAPWLGDFKRELLAFPAGHNDDQVDALVYALTRLREDSDFNRNYLKWLSMSSPNAQKQQAGTEESPGRGTIVPDPQVHRAIPESPYCPGAGDIARARVQAGFCGDCGRNCFDLSRAGISRESGGPLSRKRCNECVAQNRTGFFCSGCGRSGKAPMANCRHCGHT